MMTRTCHCLVIHSDHDITLYVSSFTGKNRAQTIRGLSFLSAEQQIPKAETHLLIPGNFQYCNYLSMYCHLYAHSDKQRMQHPFPHTSTCIPSIFYTLLRIEMWYSNYQCLMYCESSYHWKMQTLLTSRDRKLEISILSCLNNEGWGWSIGSVKY